MVLIRTIIGSALIKAPFLQTLRELAQCYQAFETYSAAHIRSVELTPPQFDVLATLGNTLGMTPGRLGEKTLITKGTLTGVVDRLEAKRLVRRTASKDDGRSQIVQLTKKGQTLFEIVFPAHVDYLSQVFLKFSKSDYARIETALKDLHMAFENSRE